MPREFMASAEYNNSSYLFMKQKPLSRDWILGFCPCDRNNAPIESLPLVRNSLFSGWKEDNEYLLKSMSIDFFLPSFLFFAPIDFHLDSSYVPFIQLPRSYPIGKSTHNLWPLSPANPQL